MDPFAAKVHGVRWVDCEHPMPEVRPAREILIVATNRPSVTRGSVFAPFTQCGACCRHLLMDTIMLQLVLQKDTFNVFLNRSLSQMNSKLKSPGFFLRLQTNHCKKHPVLGRHVEGQWGKQGQWVE